MLCVYPEQGHSAFKDSLTIVKNLMCSQNGCTKGLLRCKGNREMVLPPLSVGSLFGNSGCWRESVGLVGEGLRGTPIVLQLVPVDMPSGREGFNSVPLTGKVEESFLSCWCGFSEQQI